MSHRAPAAIASTLLILIGLGKAAEPTQGERNWPQWRGPLGVGIAPVGDPPVSWSEARNIKWKVKLPGYGQGTPVVWENKIFVQTAIATGRKAAPGTQGSAAPTAAGPGGRGGSGRRGGGFLSTTPTEAYAFVLMCIDRESGRTLWQKTACEVVPHEGHHRTEGSFAAASAITDGKCVLAFFGSRGLYCYDMDGRLKWKADFGQMRIVMSFGEGSTPALCGDIVVVNWDHEGGSFITALDKNTGKPLWKMPREERSSWATPLVVEHEGKRQVIVAATGKIRSYEPETGKMVWECAGLTRNVIPTPVVADGVVYATSGYQGNSLLAIRLGRDGDLTGTDAIAWSYRKNTPYVPSPLLYQKRIYFFSGNNAVLTCLDSATGKVLIDAKRLDALEGVYASPVAAGGRVYLAGRNGTVVVIKPSDTLEILATNRLDERFDASPAVVGNEMFLRGREHLYCIAAPAR